MKVIISPRSQQSSSPQCCCTCTPSHGIISSSIWTLRKVFPCSFPAALALDDSHLCTELQSGSLFPCPPHWFGLTIAEMQPNPIITVLAGILDQLLKDVWIQSKIQAEMTTSLEMQWFPSSLVPLLQGPLIVYILSSTPTLTPGS